jgi:hypothetical protein
MLQRLNSELQTHVHELSGKDDPSTAKLARQYDARVWGWPELRALAPACVGARVPFDPADHPECER